MSWSPKATPVRPVLGHSEQYWDRWTGLNLQYNLMSKDWWEKNGGCEMHTLNKRCEGEISPGIAFTNICSVVSDIYGRLAPLKTGMEIIQMLKLVALQTKLLRCIERVVMGWELNEQCCIAI